MITVVSVLAGALIVSVVGPRLLESLGRARDPVLALWAWPLALLGVLGSAVAALTLVVVPGHGLNTPGLEALSACWAALRGSGVPALDVAVGSLGTLIAVGAAVRAGAGAGRAAARRRRHSRDHLALLAMAADDDDGETLWVPHPRPAAFSVAGPRKVVVATTGLRRLPVALQGAVLAHEAAHLRGHHHLLISGVDLLAALGRPLPLFARAPGTVRELVERAADRAASRRYGPDVVARALHEIATHTAPPGALAMSTGPITGRLEALAKLDPGPAPRTLRAHGWCVISRGMAGAASIAAPTFAGALTMAGLVLISCS